MTENGVPVKEIDLPEIGPPPRIDRQDARLTEAPPREEDV
jgi:hypothetical protein